MSAEAIPVGSSEPSRLEFFRYHAAQTGFAGALKLRVVHKYNQIASRLGLPAFWPVLRLRIPGFRPPVYLRTGASDYAVLTQIFTRCEYEPLTTLDAGQVKTIVDCGANVGYSSMYLLERYPLAEVIAVEPDPGNAALCRKNLALYGSRARVIQSAVWSHPAKLALVTGVYRDGKEWATQVREIEPGSRELTGTELLATDMPSLLALCRDGRADILKVDIERSETVVFRNASEWLHLVSHIGIELHDEECEAIFFESLAPFQCDVSRSGDLTICRDIRLKDRVQ